MFTARIDDSQLQAFLKKSPKRALWALKEALKAAGYSFKKKVTKQIANLVPLAPSTVERKTKYNTGRHKYTTKPLELFVRLVRVSYSARGNKPFVRVGFFNTNNWFKKFFGVGAAVIAELHEKGSYVPRRRKKTADRWAKEQGMAVKSNRGGQYGLRPGRPLIGPTWNEEQHKIAPYVVRKFFALFFSKKKPGLKY